MKKTLPIIGAILVAACTFQNPVRVTPTIEASSVPQEAPEGRYVLVFDPSGARLSRTVRSSGISCPWDVYPVNIRSATLELTGRALQKILGTVELAQTSPTVAEMRQQRLDGVITFRVDKFGTSLDFDRRSSTGSATTEFVLSATLARADGRQFTRSVRSVQRSTAIRRSECRGATDAVGRSVELAMEEALDVLSEEFARNRGTTGVASISSRRETGPSRRSASVSSTASTRTRAFAPTPSTSLVEETQAALEEAGTASVGGRSVSEEDAKRIERDRRVARNRIVEEEELSEGSPVSASRTSAVAPSGVRDLRDTINQVRTLYGQGRYQEALPLAKEVVRLVERELGANHPTFAAHLNNLAALYVIQGRDIDAEPLFERALTIFENVLGPDHPEVAITLENYASLLRATNRADEAEKLEARAAAIRAK